MSFALLSMKAKLFGVTFEASFLTVALMSAVLILDVSGKVFMCFLCAIIHECGHLFAMSLFLIKPKSVTLRLFDIVIDADIDKSFLADLVITLSGPILNFLTAIPFYFISYPMFVISVFIGAFNLLPLETFDGGHALKLMLSKKLNAVAVRRVLKILTFILLLPLFFVGILVLFYSKYNYSLLLISLYLLAILFIK